MLLDKLSTNSTLYLVIYANSIEYGVFGAGTWSELREASIETEAQQNAVQLASTIQRIAADVEARLEQAALPDIEHLSVLVADCWLSSVLSPWSASTNGNANLRKLSALSQFQYAGFDVEESDTIKFLDFGYKKPSLALAYPYKLMASLEQLQKELALQLVSVLPISIAGFDALKTKLPSLDVLGIYTQNALTVVDASSGLIEIKSRHINQSDENTCAEIESEWNRIKLRASNLSDIASLPLLNLTSTDIKGENKKGTIKPLEYGLISKRQEKSKGLGLALIAQKINATIDAIPQGHLLTNLHWFGIVALLTLIVVFGAQAFKMNQQVDALEMKVSNTRTANIVIPVVEKWTKQEIKQAKAVNKTIRQLNLPFSTFMEALQPPRDIRVYILNLDLDAAATSKTSHIKMVAEAKTSGEMAQYISFLSQQKIFSGVFLTSHEKVEAVPAHPYRFNVELTWEDAS